MLEVGNHYYQLEDCSHHQVCKPKNKGHMSYKLLLELLKLSGAGKNEVRCYFCYDNNFIL